MGIIMKLFYFFQQFFSNLKNRVIFYRINYSLGRATDSLQKIGRKIDYCQNNFFYLKIKK